MQNRCIGSPAVPISFSDHRDRDDDHDHDRDDDQHNFYDTDDDDHDHHDKFHDTGDDAVIIMIALLRQIFNKQSLCKILLADVKLCEGEYIS